MSSRRHSARCFVCRVSFTELKSSKKNENNNRPMISGCSKNSTQVATINSYKHHQTQRERVLLCKEGSELVFMGREESKGAKLISLPDRITSLTK